MARDRIAGKKNRFMAGYYMAFKKWKVRLRVYQYWHLGKFLWLFNIGMTTSCWVARLMPVLTEWGVLYADWSQADQIKKIYLKTQPGCGFLKTKVVSFFC